MIRKWILFPGMLLAVLALQGQNGSEILTNEEIADLNKALAEDTLFAGVIKQFGEPVKLYENFKLNMLRSDSVWESDQEMLEIMRDLGETRKLEILPLIESFADGPGLETEPGVSYLIRTDHANILFDVGLNANNGHPSPLLNNMQKLGIGMEDFDIIVISHNHGDHVGGGNWSAMNSFSLSGKQVELPGKSVFTPVPMTYPGLEPVYTPGPVKVAEGVATLGVIHCPMFFTNVQEQAIAVNVKDIGIVIISGCGHQTIEKMVLRAERLFDQPVHALIGGLHLPVTVSRHIGIWYRWMVTGKLPWDSLKPEDVEESIAFLKRHGVIVTGLSAHDSCDWSIHAFKQAFQDHFVDLAVGKEILTGQLAAGR